MVRWGQITEQKEDVVSYYGKKIYRPDVYMKAVDELIDDGLFEESVFLPAVKANRAGGYKPATSDFIDGKTYDGKNQMTTLIALRLA